MPKKRTRRNATPSIIIIDSERRAAEKTRKLLTSAGFKAKCVEDIDTFVGKAKRTQPTVVISESRLPGWKIPDLIQALAERDVPAVTIIYTKHATVSDAVDFIQSGAFHLIEKDSRDQLLIETVNRALNYVSEIVSRVAECRDTRRKLSQLTTREAEVVQLLAYGKHNHEIAKILKIRDRTVEAHRANIMRKFETNKFMDVVRRYLLLELTSRSGCQQSG